MSNRIVIQECDNGFILKNGTITVFEATGEDNTEAVVAMLRYIADLYTTSSRYSANRIHVLTLPGDKHEGGLSKSQKESVRWLTNHLDTDE